MPTTEIHAAHPGGKRKASQCCAHQTFHKNNDMSEFQKIKRGRQGRRTIALLSIAAALIIVALLALWFSPAVLLEHWAGASELEGTDRAQATLQIAQIVAVAIGGMIAIIGVAISVSRHHEEVASSRRDQERLRAEREQDLRSRYVSAVELLADSNRPVKQMAGLHALGSLADDWQDASREDELQMCIDTICDFLRQPPTSNTHDTVDQRSEDKVVVHTIGYEIIRRHLHPDAVNHWGSQSFRLAGLVISHPIDLNHIKLSAEGNINLSKARITGNGAVNLDGAIIEHKASVHLSRAVIEKGARVSLGGAVITDDGRLHITRAIIQDSGSVNLGRVTVKKGGRLDFGQSTIRRGGSVRFGRAEVAERGRISFIKAAIADSGRVLLDHATIRAGGVVQFGEITVKDRGRVHLGQVLVENLGAISFRLAAIERGGNVFFAKATINEEASVELDQSALSGGRIQLDQAKINNDDLAKRLEELNVGTT